MLTSEDNELLCRVGPGTPMGDLMRQYWIPALLSSELPEPDGPPVRVRLLGENLIAFRDTSGKVGLIQNHCPHRGASLFFGRNEEDGLRCVYHGWKFDATGACVDMPSEPAESNFKAKVRARAYPCVERNGVVWAYMGPRPTPPPLPDLEPNMLAAASTPCRRCCASATGSRRWRATSTPATSASCTSAPSSRKTRCPAASTTTSSRTARRATRSSTPSSARRTAPTGPRRPTRTTGASPTSCSRSTR